MYLGYMCRYGQWNLYLRNRFWKYSAHLWRCILLSICFVDPDSVRSGILRAAKNTRPNGWLPTPTYLILATTAQRRPFWPPLSIYGQNLWCYLTTILSPNVQKLSEPTRNVQRVVYEPAFLGASI